jgi:hypothetical protein
LILLNAEITFLLGEFSRLLEKTTERILGSEEDEGRVDGADLISPEFPTKAISLGIA